MSISCNHCCGGIIPYIDKYIPTVFYLVSYNNGLWVHYLSGIFPFKAYNIATVRPLLSYIDGLWYHYIGISLFNITKIIAIVYPSWFYSLD